MANTVVPSWLLFCGVGAESTWNTAVTATDFYPILKPQFAVKYQPIEDDGFRANASALQAWYQGVGSTEVDLPDMLFYPNASGHFLKGILGADSLSTSTSVNTHVLTLLNTALPASYTAVKYSALTAQAERVTGTYWSEVALKFANPGKLSISVKGKGTIQALATKPSNTYESNSVFLPWQATVTIASVANAKLIDAEITLARQVDEVWGMSNTQGPTGANVGPIKVTGKLTFVPADYTELNYYLNNTQPSLLVSFASGSNSLALQMTNAAFIDPTTVDHGSPYARVVASFHAVANATDAGTGNSPLKATLVNTRNTAYG